MTRLENKVTAQLKQYGQFSPLQLVMVPLAAQKVRGFADVTSFGINQFKSYSYKSSIVVPVDSFSFTFSAPDGPPFREKIKEGDISKIVFDETTLATGLIDTVEIEVSSDGGEQVTVNGRDLMGQLEDQMCVSIQDKPFMSGKYSINDIMDRLTNNTRITKKKNKNFPDNGKSFFSSDPNESKLTALQRFLETKNSIAWMDGEGAINFGKPTFDQQPSGIIICNKTKGFSNVLDIRATFASAQIPNRVVAIWTGQQDANQLAVYKNQIHDNTAKGPNLLLQLGHRVIHTIVTSIPSANENIRTLNNLKTSNGDILGEAARRHIARENFKECIVQCRVPSHLNENGVPYVPDTTYVIDFDRGGVNEVMYLYECEYSLTAEKGQYTTLSFCKVGTIVSGAKVPGSLIKGA